MKAVIVDDEDDALVTIEQFLLKYCPQIKSIDKANSVTSATQTIDSIQPDIVFLDIQMQDGSGFDVLSAVSFRDFETIFTTAYEEYAIKAFKVKASDYLLKPINPIELKNAVAHALTVLEGKRELAELRQTITTHKVEKLGLPMKGKIELTDIDEIIRLEADANYTNVILKNDNSILVAKTLKIFEELLQNKQFIRVHQSHMVNMSYVSGFDHKESVIKMVAGDLIPVSRRYKTEVVKIIGMKII